MWRWFYRFPGDVYALGPTTKSYATEKEVRVVIRRYWELEKLPRGTEIWKANTTEYPPEEKSSCMPKLGIVS